MRLKTAPVFLHSTYIVFLYGKNVITYSGAFLYKMSLKVDFSFFGLCICVLGVPLV